ncbi:MAG: alpha-1,2-mannosidase [Rickettsiales bacterium]|nr:alpha-1,2-mannosidase [Rickettsiales bacterium]
MKTKIFILHLFIFYFTFGQQYSNYVDTKIGSKGNGLACGYNFIGPTYPFGMVQFTPSFFSPNRGFVITQLNGAGCSNMGNFPILPISGKLGVSPNDMNGYDKYEKILKSTAGHLSLSMKDDIIVDLTVSKRSGIAKFNFSESPLGTLIIGSGINSSDSKKISDAYIKITSPSSVEGYSKGGDFCGTEINYKIFFAAKFNTGAMETGTWKDKRVSLKKITSGRNSGAYFTFNTSIVKDISYQIAISFVSIENAKENLRSEKQFGDFDICKKETQKKWDENLSKIKIKSNSKDKLSQFYTHLYHSMIHPNIVSDVNGEYMGADFIKKRVESGRDHYSSFSVWDTYRTQGQLVAILFPKESSDMMESLVNFAKEAGGYGRWILANIETGIMQGDPTPILISNSYAFGGDNFDFESAYKYMKKGALQLRLRSQKQEIRPYLNEYINDGHTFASMALEYCSSDFAIAQFAKNAMSNYNDYLFFKKRSQNWKNLYNPKTKWLNSKYPNGIWKDKTHDWREGSYKNYFWMVPHNLSTLIDTIGGKEFAEKRLDSLFTRLDADYHQDWFAAGNEPDFQVPWVYNWIEKEQKTNDVINRIISEMYSSEEDGLPGNDDLGTMGAWYVFASLGLYPLIPGVGGFSTNIPQFMESEIKLGNGNILKISKNNINNNFLNKIELNKVPLESSWVSWKKIKLGGEMQFFTSNSTNKNNFTKDPPSFK